MPASYQVVLSLSKLRPAVTDTVELTVFIAAPPDLARPGLHAIVPPKGTTVTVAQHGPGRLGFGRELAFEPGASRIVLRMQPVETGMLSLRATSNFQPVTSLRPVATGGAAGRLDGIYIVPVLPMPAPGACDQRPPTPPPALVDEDWRNWHGNLRRRLRVAEPRGVPQIRAAIRDAEASGERVGLAGSSWSFSPCVAGERTQRLIRPRDTPRAIGDVLTTCLRFDLREEAEVFVHVPGGIRIHELNCLLAARGRAMPTLGGSRGQTLAGVLGTGVHGSMVDLPPIADAVCALHLVGPGGQEWWIEPEHDPITRPLQMQANRDAGSGFFCRHLRIVYSDDLFNAVLVSMGCAGVIASVVLRTVPAHELVSTTRAVAWTQARDYIAGRIVPGVDLPRFVEINLNPATMGATLVEKRIPAPGEAPPPVAPPAAALDMCHIAIAAGLLGPAAFAVFMGAVGDYIARTTAEIAGRQSIDLFLPGLGTYLAGKAAVEALDTVVEMHETLGRLGLAAVHPGDEENIARLLPLAVNLIWKIGLFVIDGRQIVDQFQTMITQQQRPEGVTRTASYVSMTGQPVCPAVDTARHGAMERLVESFEYALPADRAVAFCERVSAVVARLRASQDALVVNLNLRFTRASRALLSMQQFDRTCHVEIYTFRGMDGNAVFHRELNALVREFGAIPHWGQLHEASPELGRLFGRKLAVWQWAMNHIATAGSGRQDLFWSDFARARRLLDFEPSPTRLHPAVFETIVGGGIRFPFVPSPGP